MSAPSLVVWYNTRCPVCNGGIDWQRNKLVAAVRAGRIAFRDINEQPDALAAYGGRSMMYGAGCMRPTKRGG
jgi:predicted DCC family thiol-disulfide oxidoreductase YuxK